MKRPPRRFSEAAPNQFAIQSRGAKPLWAHSDIRQGRAMIAYPEAQPVSASGVGDRPAAAACAKKSPPTASPAAGRSPRPDGRGLRPLERRVSDGNPAFGCPAKSRSTVCSSASSVSTPTTTAARPARRQSPKRRSVWGHAGHLPAPAATTALGIRLFRIPVGIELRGVLKFPEMGIGDVELIQWFHRYVVCWPSFHPEPGSNTAGATRPAP